MAFEDLLDELQADPTISSTNRLNDGNDCGSTDKGGQDVSHASCQISYIRVGHRFRSSSHLSDRAAVRSLLRLRCVIYDILASFLSFCFCAPLGKACSNATFLC